MSEQQNIALFIDAENAPASRLNFVLSELARFGVVNIRRAYGNWKNPALSGWEALLHEHGIQPIQQFDLTKSKNASDIALVIDAMDVLHNKQVDVIAIVSSDCDFTPLVTRSLADGKVVIGFGERKTPDALVNCCSRFLYLDEEKATNAASKQTKNLKCDTKLIALLRQAIEAVEDDDGWAKLGLVGKHISNHASFDQRNYGYAKLSDLFKAIDLFELKKDKSMMCVRDKRSSK